MDLKICLQALGDVKAEAFTGKTVSIVGLGGVGSRIAELLVRHNVNVRLVDKERVYLEELPRTTLFLAEDVSKFKAKQIKKRLEAINSEVTIKTFHEELTEENAFLLRGDVIIDATNNNKISHLVYKAAMKEKIPFFSTNCAGLKGSFVVINPETHPEEDTSAFDDDGVGTIKKEGMISPLPGLIAGLLGNEVIQYFATNELHSMQYRIDLSKRELTRSEFD
jgi:molybdopterin/thiamine biosynthesis adenylyltransferase